MNERGWIRKRKTPFQHSEGTKSWCHRPHEEHVLEYTDRSHMGDIWVCPECKQVWIAVLRPSLLDAVPHWSIKWKRMCPLRAKHWRKKWEASQ